MNIILTDTKNKIYRKTFNFISEKSENCYINKYVLNGGQANGMDVIEVNNGNLSFIILPTRGMGIWRAKYNNIDLHKFGHLRVF